MVRPRDRQAGHPGDPKTRGLSREGTNRDTFPRDQRSLSSTCERPSTRLSPSTDIRRASHVPGRGQAIPQDRALSCQNSLFALQEGSVLLKVTGAQPGGGGVPTAAVFPNLPLSSFFFPWRPEPGLCCRPAGRQAGPRCPSRAGRAGPLLLLPLPQPLES